MLTAQANSHATSCIERALSSKMKMSGQMAIATALPEFNDLGRLVTPIFLLINHFLYRFAREENLSIKSLNSLQNAPSNSVLFSSSFICAMLSNAS